MDRVQKPSGIGNVDPNTHSYPSSVRKVNAFIDTIADPNRIDHHPADAFTNPDAHAHTVPCAVTDSNADADSIAR